MITKLFCLYSWTIKWGDGEVDSGDQNIIGPFGPVVHQYNSYYCQLEKVCVTVEYCHQPTHYYKDNCCDSFTKCIDPRPEITTAPPTYPTTTYTPTPTTPDTKCPTDRYCCDPVLVAPYVDYYGNPKGSAVQPFGVCQVQVASIVDYGTCSNENRYFK